MIQHTPLQEPRHAPNPACRDPGAPRPTGSPIIYEFTVQRLLSRRDVARPLKSLVCDNRSGKVENLLHLAFPLLHVMVTSGSRVRDEDDAPEFVADNQAAMAGSLIFPCPHLGGALP